MDAAADAMHDANVAILVAKVPVVDGVAICVAVLAEVAPGLDVEVQGFAALEVALIVGGPPLATFGRAVGRPDKAAIGGAVGRPPRVVM